MSTELAPRKFSLFDHEAELLSLTSEMMDYSDRGEEPPPELLDAIAGGITATAEKRDRVAAFIRYVETQPEAIDAEIKRLQARKKSIARGAANLRSYVYRTMVATKQRVLEGAVSTFKIVKNPPSVEVTDVAALPDSMVNVKVEFTVSRGVYNEILGELNEMADQVSFTVTPNKNLIAQILKAEPDALPGATLKTSERLEIK